MQLQWILPTGNINLLWLIFSQISRTGFKWIETLGAEPIENEDKKASYCGGADTIVTPKQQEEIAK